MMNHTLDEVAGYLFKDPPPSRSHCTSSLSPFYWRVSFSASSAKDLTLLPATMSTSTRTPPLSPAIGHVILIVHQLPEMELRDSLYLEVPIEIVTTICFVGTKYLGYLGFSILNHVGRIRKAQVEPLWILRSPLKASSTSLFQVERTLVCILCPARAQIIRRVRYLCVLQSKSWSFLAKSLTGSGTDRISSASASKKLIVKNRRARQVGADQTERGLGYLRQPS